MADQSAKQAAKGATAVKISRADARAAKKAEKLRKKNSLDPADMGRLRQIKRAYQLTHEYDKWLPLYIWGSWALSIAVFVVIGLLTRQLVFLAIMGVMIGMLVAMIILVQRTKKATYKRHMGQAGSAEVALSFLPKQWVSTPVIAATRQRDAIHRTLGPGGLVKKHERVAYGVKVTTLVMGDKAGQVPLDKLADHIRKLPKVLQPNQVTDVKLRLRALDAVRPPIPLPKGPMPTKPGQVKGAKQAMRGR
jgi:hypothetical protein